MGTKVSVVQHNGDVKGTRAGAHSMPLEPRSEALVVGGRKGFMRGELATKVGDEVSSGADGLKA
eukprot:6080847-Alexandrium_andersonii.AAC.1